VAAPHIECTRESTHAPPGRTRLGRQASGTRRTHPLTAARSGPCLGRHGGIRRPHRFAHDDT
jgi:hypothetical protein